jgi:DNA-binding GntR family transcriptional regulator
VRRSGAECGEGGTSPLEVSAAQLAYLRIAERLATGEAAPGTWLRERTLAESMGISRTPVREALNKLAAEGLVRMERHRGAQVVRWTREQIVEIYGLRAATEGYVASLAAQKIDEPTLAKLESNLAEYQQVIQEQRDATRARAAELNNEFHSLLLEATANDSLVYLVNGVIGLPLVRRTFLRYNARDLQRSVEHHRELIEALRARESDTAAMIMQLHIRAAQRASLRSERLETD